jgi:hypothetical protein
LKIKLFLFFNLLAVLIILAACNNPETSKLPESTWLSPGKIQINNLRAGNSIEQMIKIHNGNKLDTWFSIYYRVPDYVESNYISAPEKAREWVTITDNSPLLKPNEIKEIKVILKIPDKTLASENWEFWVGVKENTTQSLTKELCCRWLINMR